FATEVPILWKSQQLKPISLTIGRPDGCDLFSIVKEGCIEKDGQLDDRPVLSIYPLAPVLSLQREWRGPCRLRLTLQARGVETDANVLRVEIVWSGNWSDDPAKLGSKLIKLRCRCGSRLSGFCCPTH